jgi:hypothetical protein
MRNLDTSLATALSNRLISPVILVILTFRTSTKFIWSGVGNFVFGGNTYVGVGSLGRIGVVTEGSDVNAQGTTVTLSGIDPALLQDCMTDIQLGAPASIYFGLMSDGVLIGNPYQLFVGQVDVPSVTVGAKSISISLALENKLINLSRPSLRRYTTADQRLYYPTDIAFAYVEQLNDLAVVWGQ